MLLYPATIPPTEDTSLMSPRKIVVFGATGKQGSSVARSLVADKNYTVLGITRNPDSAAANGMSHQMVIGD